MYCMYTVKILTFGFAHDVHCKTATYLSNSVVLNLYSIYLLISYYTIQSGFLHSYCTYSTYDCTLYIVLLSAVSLKSSVASSRVRISASDPPSVLYNRNNKISVLDFCNTFRRYPHVYTVGPRLSSLAIGNANPVLDKYPLDNQVLAILN